MRLSLFYNLDQLTGSGEPEDERLSELYAAVQEQIIRGDELGFTTAWVAEHHFALYGRLPAPLLFLARVSALTTRIGLGTAVVEPLCGVQVGFDRTDQIVGEGLQENDRTGFGFLEKEAWRAAFVAFFARPGERIMGNESAYEARERFTQAVERVIALYPGERIAIVTHGTVLSLFVSAVNAVEPFDLWNHLTCPAFVELSLPDYRALQVVDHAV